MKSLTPSMLYSSHSSFTFMKKNPSLSMSLVNIRTNT